MARNHETDLALALRLADVADEVTMRSFRSTDLRHELKADGSPVTEADLACEEAVAAAIAEASPGDGVLGEEIGERPGSTGRRWIVDGIDGTVLYVAGRRGWATEIALEVDGELVVGVATSPALERRWWGAKGGGAFTAGDAAGTTPLRVSSTDSLADATCSAIPPLSVLEGGERAAAEALASACDRYADAAGHCALEVAAGAVEVGFQPRGGPWDFASLAVIVEAAGGRFSDLGGEHRIDRGGPVVFSNGVLHDAVLALYR